MYAGSEQVIADFLRKSSSINFVLVVFVEVLYTTYPHRAGYKVTTELYLNDNLPGLDEQLRDTLNSLEQFFPAPEIDTRRALSNLKKRHLDGYDFCQPLLAFPNKTLLEESNYAQPTITVTNHSLRKWTNPIKKTNIRRYSMKIVTNVIPTEAEKREAEQAIAQGAQGIDDVGNILAPPSLQKRVFSAHPRIISDVRSGKTDILYDPLTYQVIAASRTK